MLYENVDAFDLLFYLKFQAPTKADLGREGWEEDLGRAAVYRRRSGQGGRVWLSGQGSKSEGLGRDAGPGREEYEASGENLRRRMRVNGGDGWARRRWPNARAGKMHGRGEEKGTQGRWEAGRWRGREDWEDARERRREGDSGAAGGWSLEGVGGLVRCTREEKRRGLGGDGRLIAGGGERAGKTYKRGE
ncbi:hypothetical protein ACLOJK_005198 [Asimina triloba]